MPDRAVLIDSYFALPTDLAKAMRTWPEFVSGEAYATVLRSDAEVVSTSLEQDDGRPYVLVRGEGDGALFFRVLGQTLYTLAENSDDVWPRVIKLDPDGRSGS